MNTFPFKPYSSPPTRENAFGYQGRPIDTGARFYATWDNGGERAISVWFGPEGVTGVKWSRLPAANPEFVRLERLEDNYALWAWLVGLPDDHTFCTGCLKEIDPETCGCGGSEVDSEHGSYGCEWFTHPFIPMGCDCYRSSRNNNNNEEKSS